MSTRTYRTADRGPRSARLLSRLTDRRRGSAGRRELEHALAGHHGPGVQADVLAALRR